MSNLEDVKRKFDTLILHKATIDKHGWHCIKCWQEDAEDYVCNKNDNLELKETDYSELVEYWVCPECDTEYQVDVTIQRDFLTMTEVA